MEGGEEREGRNTFGDEVPVEVVVAGEADGDAGRYAE